MPTDASRLPPSEAELRNELSGYSRDHREDWQRRRSAKQLVKEAPRGPGLPAGLDPNRSPAGRFVKGHGVRSGGPRKRKSLKEALLEAQEADATGDLARRLAARAVGDTVENVPYFETVQELQAWVRTMRSLAGCIEDFREIGDRIDPKPQKISLDATLTAKRAPIPAAGTAPDEAIEAERYYQSLAANATSDEDEEDIAAAEAALAEPGERVPYESPEPARSAGEDDLSFLE